MNETEEQKKMKLLQEFMQKSESWELKKRLAVYIGQRAWLHYHQKLRAFLNK